MIEKNKMGTIIQIKSRILSPKSKTKRWGEKNTRKREDMTMKDIKVINTARVVQTARIKAMTSQKISSRDFINKYWTPWNSSGRTFMENLIDKNDSIPWNKRKKLHPPTRGNQWGWSRRESQRASRWWPVYEKKQSKWRKCRTLSTGQN